LFNNAEQCVIRLGLRHLTVIRSIGNTGNVSATARELGLTPSAVSHRMREGHSISLTPAGRRVEEAANRVLAEIALAERDVGHLGSGFDLVLRFGAACYAGFDWFPALLAKIEASLESCSAEIVPDISEDPTSLIVDRNADIVLVAGQVERPDIGCTTLVDDELVVVMSPSHPMAALDWIEPESIAGEDYVTHHTIPERGREYDNIFRPFRILPKRVISAGRTQAVLSVVESGRAITILPKLAVAAHARRAGLAMRAISEAGIPIKWYALTRASAANAVVVARAVDLLGDCLARPGPENA
jgi:LysR family transcriptional regulator for metE and metH